MSETKRQTITDLSDVRVGDVVRVTGYGSTERGAASLYGDEVVVFGRHGDWISGKVRGWAFPDIAFHLCNIVAIEREVREPEPKPGEWRHEFDGGLIKLACRGRGACQFPTHRVYRAATLYAPAEWSEDTRKGERRGR